MYVINENPNKQDHSQYFNTSINKNVYHKEPISGTLQNLDSNSMTVLPRPKFPKTTSMLNCLGKRPDMNEDPHPPAFRISSHLLESPIHSKFNDKISHGNDRAKFSPCYPQRSPLYQAQQMSIDQEALISMKNKHEKEMENKKIMEKRNSFFVQNKRGPSTPDERNLQPRLSNNQKMNLNLQDFNLSNKASNPSYNCSPFLNRSPLSDFDKMKQFENYKSNCFSNNFFLDIQSHKESDKIQYSFNKTKILTDNNKSPKRNHHFLNKLTKLCEKTMKFDKNKFDFMNRKAPNYFGNLFKETDKAKKTYQEGVQK